MQVLGSLTSAALFMHFIEVVQPSFQGWGDVFFFCGEQFQFCTCSLQWNLLGASPAARARYLAKYSERAAPQLRTLAVLDCISEAVRNRRHAIMSSLNLHHVTAGMTAGYYKAVVIWCFVLGSAAGVRALVAQLALGGPLPGEEAVEHEVLYAVLWRLVPFYMNKWEQARALTRTLCGRCVVALQFDLGSLAIVTWPCLGWCCLVCVYAARLKVPSELTLADSGERGVQAWGVECASVLYAAPHIALELLLLQPLLHVRPFAGLI